MRGLGLVLALAPLGFLVTVTASAPSATIEGRVVVGWAREPVAYTNVILLGSKLGTMTDSVGRFRLEDVPPGQQRLRIQAIGYSSWVEETLTVQPGSRIEREVRLPGSGVRDSLLGIGRWPPHLDSTVAARLSDSKRLEVVRLHEAPRLPGNGQHPWPADAFDSAHRTRIVPIEWRDSLLAMFKEADFATPATGARLICECQPDIGIRAIGDSGELVLALCYECGTVEFFSTGVSVPPAWFGNAGAKLVKMGHELFPDDPPQWKGHPAAAAPRDFGFEFGTGNGDRVNTFQGLVTKDLVALPDTTIRLAFTRAELDSVYAKMVQVHLLCLSDPQPGECMIDPSTSIWLVVRADGAERQFRWETGWGCGASVRSSESWKSLYEVIGLIRRIVNARPEYKALPRPRGGYI